MTTPHANGLDGILVLELSSTPGAAFAGALFADFNAQIIVAEPLAGSGLRNVGPAGWWEVTARDKQSIAIDADAPEAGEIIAEILKRTTVIITDLAPDQQPDCPWLRRLDALPCPPLVIRLLPTGADRPELWPWSVRPEFTAATSGMMALTGHPDEPPVQPEMPLAEYLAGALAVVRAVAELRRSHLAGGAPRAVTVMLHQAVQRMVEWQLPVSSALGRAELRVGNAFPMAAGVANMFRTRDGRYLAVSAANEASARKLLKMIGGTALSDNPDFMSVEGRGQSIEKIYALLGAWMLDRDAEAAIAEALVHDVVVGPIFDTDDIANDEQIAARCGILSLPGLNGETVGMPSIAPRVSSIATNVRHVGPPRGADGERILAELGFAPAAIARFVQQGIVFQDDC